MSRAGRVLLIVGVFISLIAGGVVFLLLATSQPKQADVPTTKMVIAFQNISSRTEILPEQVGLAEWPRALPTPVGAFDESDDVLGKLASVPISPGQPITDKMLIDKGEVKETHSHASLLIEKGNVAVALPVNVKSNVAEAIQVGDRVDVIATLKSQSTSTSALVTQRLLADILVLQVGPWPSPAAKSTSASTGATVLTLQLTEQDVLVLEHTQQIASAFTLVLRPALDRDVLPLEPVTFDYINQRFDYHLPR